MPSRLKQVVFPLTVFITGACVLIIEIAAIRALAPYFGNTIFTTSGVITVILIALSFGYYAGGRFADTHPHWAWFFRIIMVSGLLVVAFHIAAMFFLPTLRTLLHPFIAPILSSFIFFLLPAFLLGTLSPYAIKLQHLVTPKKGIGSVSGLIFFWSTLGSITGSLVVAFILIPTLGTNTIFIGTGVALFLLGCIPLCTRRRWKGTLISTVLLLMLLGLFSFGNRLLTAPYVYATDGLYERITIADGMHEGRPARFLLQNTNLSSGKYLDTDDPTDLPFKYAEYYRLYKPFTKNPRRVLVLGGGAYTVPNALVHEIPEAVVDVAEIEPGLPEIVEEYFGIKPHPRMVNHIKDGRQLLVETEEPYDIIFGDAFSSFWSVPFHLTTKEFFQLTEEKLSSDGVIIINFIGNLSGRKPSFLLSVARTFREVFPNSHFFAVRSPDRRETQNIMFFGYKGERRDIYEALEHPELAHMTDHLIDLSQFTMEEYSILTDDYAPVDFMILRSLR